MKNGHLAINCDPAAAVVQGSFWGVTRRRQAEDPPSRGIVTDQVILSLFPGADLLGRGFEEEGFCVVRGPDRLWGGDIRRFTGRPGRFEGIIGGSPCQDFSKARRAAPTGDGLAMLAEYLRVVDECRPWWFLLENVPGVPDVALAGYRVQRLDVRANEFGLKQKRVRHVQVGLREDLRWGLLIVPRVTEPGGVTEPAALAREGSRVGGKRRSWAEFCELQGVTDLELLSLRKSARYAAVGNGVAVPVARAFARAIRDWRVVTGRSACTCGCGRVVTGRQRLALSACRKRCERRRRAARAAGV